MPTRRISLYYGSVEWAQALTGWASSCAVGNSGPALRGALHEVVRAEYGGGAVFSFGSGRGALAACLKGAGIGVDAKVLLSAYTCLAVPTAVVAVGATPVYVDIDPLTLNVTASDVIDALTSDVRAVVVQHTLGKAAPIEAIAEAARARGILVIEDCALALGSTIGGRQVGTFGDAAVFSMELSKTLSCGWGGVLLVSNEELAARVANVYSTLPEQTWLSSTRDAWQTAISAWCSQPERRGAVRKLILRIGFKSGLFRPSTPASEFDGTVSQQFMRKMGGAQAAFAKSQWSRVRSIVQNCAAHVRDLRSTLDELGLAVPGAPGVSEVSVAPRVTFLVTDRVKATQYFLERGIELGQWFDGPLSPVPRASSFNYRSGTYCRAERIARTVVNLPSHSGLTDSDVSWIRKILTEFVLDHPGCAVDASVLTHGPQ